MAVELAPELLTPRRKAANGEAVSGATLKYSADGKYLFQREAHVIRVINTKNGQLLHECIRAEAQPLGAIADEEKKVQQQESSPQGAIVGGDRQQVTALALHPHNALQLIAAYDDGKVLVWDFSEEKILQEFDAKVSILWMESSSVSPSMLMMVVSALDDSSKWSLIEFNMKKKRRGRTLLEQSKLAFKSASMQSYKATGGDEPELKSSNERFHGDYVVIAADARLFAVRVQRDQDGSVSAGRPFTTQKYTHLRDITCLAVHPSSAEFVIGDCIGQLYRYHGLGAATTSKMHWHSHAVKCVAYSTDGNFLLSGGEECVFVSWHIESGRRSYLPRRSAPLAAIATRTDGAGYAIALDDHVLFQYNYITREEEWHSLGLARSGEAASVTLPSRQLVFDPISNAIPLNGLSSAGVLQFYDPYKDRVLQSVVLTERNQVTRTEDEEIPQILAEQLQFSPSGQELVTLHSNYLSKQNDKKKNGDEQSLRFWKRRENGSFFVNTAIDAPHGSELVTCMAFSPSTYNESVVTGDNSGEFKVWKKNAESASWYCQSVVQFREEPITAVAFADDGSLLAVAYNHLLTLWDVGTNALRHVISSADGAAIRQVSFTGKTSPYVVLTTETQVQVWSLLSFELWWRYEVPKESFVSVNARKEQFLVWLKSGEDTQQHLVLVFQPASPVPIEMRALNVGEQGVWSVQFHPKNGDLVVLDGESNVWRIGDSSIDKNRRKDAVQSEAEVNALDAMFKRASSQAATGGKKHLVANRQIAANSGNANALFEAPAHVLPSMTALYRSFMDTMLPKPNAQVADAAGDDDAGASGSKRQKKKNNKKRKKQQQSQGQNGEDASAGPESSGTLEDKDDKQKRMKLFVEKELANPALQQQTYSKLLEAFRKNKQQTTTAQ